MPFTYNGHTTIFTRPAMMGLFSRSTLGVGSGKEGRPRESPIADDKAPEDTEPDDTSILCALRDVSFPIGIGPYN